MSKTWVQKLNSGKPAHIDVMKTSMWGVKAGARLYISTPLEIKAYIEAIPEGETRTINDMRNDLAQKAGAELTCPMTASIFTRIVAEAALEVGGQDADAAMTPFWRLIEPNAPLAKKLSCGSDFITHQRRLEPKS